MVTNESAKLTVRLITERHQELVGCVDRIQSVFSDTNGDAKVELAKTALEKAITLQESLSTTDRPNWLQPLVHSLDSYLKRPNDANKRTQLMKTVADHWQAIHHFEVTYTEEPGVKAFDFDAVYLKYYEQSELPQLFDKLVEQLREIIASDELDSRKVAHALDLLAATLENNKKGSFFSVNCSWDFARTYMKNVLWAVLEECPGLKVFTKALRKTMEETDAKMQKLHQDVQEDLHKQITVEFPSLTYHPLALPAPTEEDENDSQDTIDV